MRPWQERPAQGTRLPIVVSIPHTGTRLPDSVAARLASDELRRLPMTDWHLHELYDFLPPLGVTTVHARFSRLVIDLNRPPDGGALYPGRFETGLVPAETFDGERIFREPPDAALIEALRVRYHEPYHRRLAELLRETVERFGRAVLVDAHSVAARPNRLHGALTGDIYLGDGDGTTCAPWLTDALAASFTALGLRVERNAPYKGGYITRFYGGQPGVDAVQIEMCQRLYMDEERPHARDEEKWKTMKQQLTTVFVGLAQRLDR